MRRRPGADGEGSPPARSSHGSARVRPYRASTRSRMRSVAARHRLDEDLVQLLELGPQLPVDPRTELLELAGTERVDEVDPRADEHLPYAGEHRQQVDHVVDPSDVSSRFRSSAAAAGRPACR